MNVVQIELFGWGIKGRKLFLSGGKKQTQKTCAMWNEREIREDRQETRSRAGEMKVV